MFDRILLDDGQLILNTQSLDIGEVHAFLKTYGCHKRAGWQGKQRAITFLGNLWDRHDAEQKEPGSRIRSLRNWEQRRKGRPKFQTFCSLANAVTVEQALLAGESAEGRDYDTWMQAVILRIGETLTETLYALNTLGVEATHIVGIMDAYRQEYRIAREALGKPMSQL
ncbi:hypothetical protein [Pseudomonas syringae]|uniref:hypothetical protein n=1 Tax=Pseudomonas syringae TaxID=317 RepID=UPI00211A6065|nr:hypothetical protein [Pseudomonas syringae]